MIENVSLSLGHFSMQIDSLELPDSGVTALWGPSGSGKTTFFNLLVGGISVPGWSWKMDGIDLAKLTISDRQLGVVFQSYELFPHLSAEKNVRLVFEARNSGNFSEAVAPYIQKLNLQNCWHTRAADISGGEKQRVALLRALMSKPRVLLMDEPFAALDPASRLAARETVHSLLQELQVPTYLITHDWDDVRSLAQNVIHIKAGQFSDVKKVDK
ncbi:MAG: hypothetical protein A2622_03220 [Bdellovibrionales bacterium RIFCSPHIGHO2_01_FULL_40_29]|nr:MAG: hypothetical protein A2622_03220 [Bdellovibrionales bacterium RIFCSPHIGHO2_01_FULL_40_29]OFZ34144.1 MAG: hypothetical protein A3D17_03640 [Bdellovibrionales bacterium RIFCSPHIGHO2_02_FULL_40_15]